MAIFSQQWPRLRRNFRFCTGALSLRNNTFDLAIAPFEVARSKSEKTVIITNEQVQQLRSNVSEEDWISLAARDLNSGDVQTEFRQFLWRYGPDYNNGREVFHALSDIYLASARGSTAATVNQVLSAVGFFFPERNASNRLKLEFFGKGGRFSQLHGGEGDVLRALITNPAADLIEEEIAQIESRGRSLTSFDLESATDIALLALRLGGSKATDFINGFCEGVASNEDALQIIPISLVVELVARRSDLLVHGGVWRRSTDEQATLCTLFAVQRLSGKVSVKSVVDAILVGEAWHALAIMCEQFGRDAILSVLQWINSQDRKSLEVPQEVSQVLSSRSALVAEIIPSEGLRKPSLKVLSAILDARSYGLRRIGAAPWVAIADEGLRLTIRKQEIRSRAFMLAIGLGFHALRLVTAGFSDVYEAARTNELEKSDFDMLEPYLPWYSPEWDLCARLIRAAVRAFVTEPMSANEFLSTFSNEEQLSRALVESGRTWDGRRYIRRMYERITAGEIIPNAIQRMALSQYSG